MDSEKHVHISSPKGPEDASGIADEYPSPERTPATLSEHVPVEDSLLQQQEQQSEQETNDNAETHHQQHQQEDTDMQTELANQVAAQAIEAAVAAEVRANSNSNSNSVTQNQDVDMNIHQQQQQNNEEHIRHQQHNPRQPTFPKSRIPPASSSSLSPHYAHALPRSGKHSATPKLTPNEQIAVLREAYAKNPNPGKKELEYLAERTGRPWNKIREYFRQRRNKLRGLEDLENMQEPGRASGWLQVAYRQAPATSSITQLSLYNSYKHRFDPYSITTPLLGGQELIQLACATFPGCEMAKDENEYVLKGLKEKEKEKENGDQNEGNAVEGENPGDQEEWEKGMEGLVEPLRAGSWLLSSFQHQNDPNAPSTLTQTDLYTSYAARFSSLLTNAGQPENPTSQDQPQPQAEQQQPTQEEQDHEADMRAFEEAGLNDGANDQDNDDAETEHQSLASLLPDQPSLSPAPLPLVPQQKKENRLLNPFELINLTRMTFPKCEPMVDSSGKFVIKGLERRLGHIPGSSQREREMFDFALYNESKPGEAFVGLMKRKLGMLNSEASPASASKDIDGEAEAEADGRDAKKLKLNEKHPEEEGEKRDERELTEEDKELIQGLKRFRNSQLGDQVRDVCISQ
ncbi:hypothetical protein I302_100773 [Kwoniella bestiolae CBS 10118]|uniref:Homeobox domain-containing protein n=1 Tax=Kwoniella bestiolae CBS 10118 TaxID=1296100 RepID=A0AAJ8K0M9_9TREE